MRYGVSIPNMGDAGEVVAVGLAADAAGWDGVFLWDHLHFLRDARVDVHDPWVLLGALAAGTRRVRLGTLVTPLARRRPQVVAKEVVTLDHLSSGRAVLGVGLGEPGQDEFAAFGEDPDPAVRAARLDEALAVVEALWTGEPVTHVGTHFRVDAELHPMPVQRPRPPVWVAGLWPNRRPLRRSLRFDGFVPVGGDGEPLGPERVAEVAATLRSEGAPPGFDLVATAMDGVEPADYAAAGATWLVWSCWPVGDWPPALRAVVQAGPPA